MGILVRELPNRVAETAQFHGRAGEWACSFALDDGSTGTLRVESEPCGSAGNCLPESFRIDVEDEAGRRVARLPLSAAYGVFDLVPVDLVDGPGDELVIVRIPTHASPPVGIDLRIWKLGATVPVDLRASPAAHTRS